MKEDLVRHICGIFDSLGITVSFELYDCKNDVLPEWAKNIELTNDFLICCLDCSLKQRLELFTGKKVIENSKYIYWFEGERISPVALSDEDKSIINTIKLTPSDSLKTKTRLPAFLDNFIFNKLNAIYEPDFQRFEYNLDLEGNEILKYLGTYFPRSYAESFCIFDNIFQNKAYHHILSKKECLNILSVGCGTGGDIIGLLTTIEKHFHNISEVNIWALDGNIEAMTILEQIIDDFQVQTAKRIKLKTLQFVFNSISNFEFENEIDYKFDFILSFKFICEIIAMGKGSLDNSYYSFTHKFLSFLSDDGLFLLLDVTTKQKHNTFNPILMNHQVNQALSELSEYGILLPFPCSVYGERCFHDCFQQKTFSITHSKHTNDKSKVAYRLIVSNDLKRKFGLNGNESKQLIYNDKICLYTENGIMKEDAYLLK